MKAADLPVQRPRDARLLAADARGVLRHLPRVALASLLRPDDLVVANDAATLPASLHGVHAASGAPVEVRLAGRDSLAADAVHEFSAVVFGAGDHRTPTEARPAPPPLAVGDSLVLGPLRATVLAVLGHPRLVRLRFAGRADAVWAGLARHGRPVQYAHLRAPLALWDVWTRVAAQPVAFEPPSAGFVLDWALLDTLRARGVGFATLTHAAGLSSTGDAALDARLPFDEPYHLPAATVRAVERARAQGARVVAVGTTVVRALEHAAAWGLAPGPGLATQRLGAHSRLQVVDVLVSGTHEPGTSHHALLHAFAGAATIARMDAALAAGGYRTHEFGDSMWLEAVAGAAATARRRDATPAFVHQGNEAATTA